VSPRRPVFGAVAGLIVWLWAGEPLPWYWLAADVAAGLAIYPLALIGVYCLPAVAAAAVPRTWRCWWRHRHDRPAIPQRLRRAVYAADRYACVYCGADHDLQLDHVRPWASGGLSSLFNLVTLCGTCNRVKSNYWVYPSGLVVYRPLAGNGLAAVRQAAAILSAERRARWNPARWARAAWALD
jgi:5-methylcytosine-specific restriction protein A